MFSGVVDVNRDTWNGRLYRATDNFYLCSLAQSNKVVDTNDARMTAMKVLTKDGPILLHDVYMSVYYLRQGGYVIVVVCLSVY